MTTVTLPLVIDAVAKASLVLAVAALAAAALRRASASARHFVWTLGLLSALAAPALSLALPRWELPIVTFAAKDAIPAAQPLERSEPAAAVAPAFSGTRTQPPSLAKNGDSVRPETTSARSLPSWPVLALIGWAAGASIILARLLVGLLAVQWLSRRTAQVTQAPWLPQAQALARELGLSGVRFLRGAEGTMPMAWGIVRRSVLVPVDADTWPAHRVRVVLLHELAHVKRRDCLTHLVAQLACAAYWFNPLVWMAVRRLRAERERACDDLVLASGTRGSDYADQLLDIARVMQSGRFPAVFAGASLAMAQRSQLEGRLIAILDPSVPRRGLSRARAAAAAVVFAAVMIPIASVQPWAEERPAAIDPSMADAASAAASTSAAPAAEQPGEQQPTSSPKPARNTGLKEGIEGGVAGGVTGGVTGGVVNGVVGGITGGIAGAIASSVPGSVAGSVPGSVVGSVTAAVVGGVVSAVGNGVASGIASAASEIAREVEHDVEQDKQDKDAPKGRGRDPRAANALIEALKDSDKGVRETAMQALVQMRDPRMFDPLVAALKDASPGVREQAAFGLGQLRDVRAVTPLASALKDENPSVREQAVFALGQLRAASAIDAIAQALRDASPSVREQAAFALSQIRDRRAVEPLISSLKDESASVRHQAAFALGQIRASTAVEALVIAVKDANASVREQVVFALGQIGDPRAVDALMAALKDTSASVRQQAAFALGQIR